MAPGAAGYKEGAIRRLEDAWRLFEAQQWEGCVYLAGRAAQAMLRSLIVRYDDNLKLGHLEDDEPLVNAMNELAILWRNDLRFTGAKRFRQLLVKAGRVKRVRGRAIIGDPEKPNARALLDAAQTVITKDLQGTAELETLPNGHVSGEVVSPLFEGKDYHDRRMLIRDALRKRADRGELSPDEQLQVSTLLTYTPAEWNVATSDLN